MDTLPDSVTMSTSHSAEASADDVAIAAGNSGNGQNAAQTAVLRKLSEGKYDLADLPQARDEPLWGAIRDEHDLSLGELSALKNFACAVVTRPRGVLPRIESGTVYRVSDERIRAKSTISNQVHPHHYIMDAELMLDSGANTELRLPARKARQLGLVPRGAPIRCRGATNNVCLVMIFSPVLVKATFIRDGVDEIVQADLIVKCDKDEYDALGEIQPVAGGNSGGEPFATPLVHQPTMASPGTGGTPASTDEASRITEVHLTPTKHRPNDFLSNRLSLELME
jgi:hypothetical protein